MKEASFSIIKRFIRGNIGAVSIEFFFMLILLISIFAFMADLVIIRSSQGKLDNASYSLVTILRERTQLYAGTETITGDEPGDEMTENDLTQFRKLAQNILYGKNSNQKVLVTMEYWDGRNGAKIWGDSVQCPPYKALSRQDVQKLSPYSEKGGRRIPIYQFTLCLEHNSLFRNIILDEPAKTANFVRSSSSALSRTR